MAIVSMGCTKFGEHWDRSADDLLIDAVGEALSTSPVQAEDVEAYWLGTVSAGQSGLTLSRPLHIQYRPVSRVENYCATGSEAFRNACYGVASGAFNVAMAVGVEKLKDNGMVGLPPMPGRTDGTQTEISAPALFGMIAPAYAERFGLDDEQMREILTRIAWKNHHNGSRNPRAHFRQEVAREVISTAPQVAGPLRLFDCSGVSDGAAAAIIVPAEDAHKYTDSPIFVKALSLIAGPANGTISPDYDFTTFEEVARSARDAYAQAGISDPRHQLAMAEVHDCFTPTELVLMEDLGFAERGTAWKDVLAGSFDLDGDLPVNPDGGLKSFGHPIGASGLRMMFEAWLQLRGEAPEERILGTVRDEGRTLALTHNLGGAPGECVSFVSILGSSLGVASD